MQLDPGGGSTDKSSYNKQLAKDELLTFPLKMKNY